MHVISIRALNKRLIFHIPFAELSWLLIFGKIVSTIISINNNSDSLCINRPIWKQNTEEDENCNWISQGRSNYSLINVIIIRGIKERRDNIFRKVRLNTRQKENFSIYLRMYCSHETSTTPFSLKAGYLLFMCLKETEQ